MRTKIKYCVVMIEKWWRKSRENKDIKKGI